MTNAPANSGFFGSITSLFGSKKPANAPPAPTPNAVPPAVPVAQGGRRKYGKKTRKARKHGKKTRRH